MTFPDQNTSFDARLSSLFSAKNIVLLDAGLGTTLEDVLQQDISHPLWSAHLIKSDPEVIVAAHLAFLKAGSSIVLTATYQCAQETFMRAGYTPEQGRDIMHEAIRLAIRARSQYQDLVSGGATPKIALSLGPYGATTSPASEFTGIYPVPYGPPQPGTSFRSSNAPGDSRKEQESEDALVEFHLSRLRIYASSPESWNNIDILAFETVPLLREARAIRRAIALLANTSPSIRIPPWWISFNFAEGNLAETDPTGANYTAADAVRICFEQLNQPHTPVPSAFGINCTHIKHVKRCILAASQALQEVYIQSSDKINQATLSQLGLRGEAGSGPALVIYPNGGRIYVPETMTWLPPSPMAPELDGLSEAQMWARKLVKAVLEGVPPQAAWGGLIIGGCCKTEPENISALKDLI